ncbi:MAG: sulfatase [Bacteroidetes bacterium]|nr:sulfatase [Bacteroidota bacterium]
MKPLFVAALALIMVSGCNGKTQIEEPTRRPNVILIMVDDLGWTDLHIQGNEKLETPRLDHFASQGMRFTDGYAAAPVCSPTRAAIMTGMSPARLALTNHVSGNQERFRPPGATLGAAEMIDYLDLNYVTLAERLKDGGYTTGFFGKWHLSGTDREMETVEPSRRPQHQGFDVNVGGLSFGGPPSFFDPYRNPELKDRQEGEYLPFRLADEAMGFIEAHQDEPFFVALWPYTVHWPMEAPQELVDKYANRPGFKDYGDGIESSTTYAAMIEAMDDAVGRVLAKLDELNLAEETLVIFTSDNGAYGGVTDLAPLRGVKGHLYEGGIRVPLIVRWPGQIKAGVVSGEPVISTDFFATILDVAGLDPTPDVPLDGESILPILRQTGNMEREAIYFHYPNYAFHGENRLGSAIRQGNYKLIHFYDQDEVELYDVVNDLSETTNLAREMPERATEMKANLGAWLKASGAKMPRPL